MFFTKKKAAPRVCVIGIDGVPHSFIEEQLRRGVFPHMARILRDGASRRMMTTIPPISSVAWTSFSTGMNPAKHRIFGFMDRRLSPFEVFIPTSSRRAAPTLWKILGDNGRKVGVMNVPVSYPPEPVNGFLVSCFLATNPTKATYPVELADELKGMGYVIDVDTWKVRENRAAFLDDLFAALKKRLEVTLHLMKTRQWDFFMSHVMETDRISHFFWSLMERNDPTFGARTLDLFREVDAFLGAVYDQLPPDTVFVVLSDHGFCSVKKEINVNTWLMDAGLLKMRSDDSKALNEMLPESTCYSMLPGRFFLNLKGREPGGAIEPGAPSERAAKAIIEFCRNMRDPETGEPIIREVHRREEIMSGPYLHEAADILALPHNGYDLKANFQRKPPTTVDALHGMHTHDDAFLFVSGRDISAGLPNIIDIAPSILNLMGVTPPADMDGKVIF